MSAKNQDSIRYCRDYSKPFLKWLDWEEISPSACRRKLFHYALHTIQKQKHLHSNYEAYMTVTHNAFDWPPKLVNFLEAISSTVTQTSWTLLPKPSAIQRHWTNQKMRIRQQALHLKDKHISFQGETKKNRKWNILLDHSPPAGAGVLLDVHWHLVALLVSRLQSWLSGKTQVRSW